MAVESTSSADSTSRPAVLDRRLSLAGLVGPVVFWVLVITLGFLTPGYSHLHDAISDLGAIGAPYGVVQQANFVVLGLGILAFVVVVDRQFRAGGWPWIGVVLVGLLGLLGAIGSGVFPVDPASGAQLTDQLHGIGVIVGFHAGLIGIPLTTRRLANEDAWPAYHGRRATLGISAVVVASYAVFIGLGLDVDGYGGIAQRLYAG